MSTPSAAFKRAAQATTAANRMKTPPSVNGSSGNNLRPSSSFGVESEAASQFERLSSAVNDEQLSQRISIVKAQVDSDPNFLLQWAHLIVEKEYGWLAVMQRVFNNPNEGSGARDKASLSAILCKVATKLDEVKGLRTVLLATKLSCILTVDGPGVTDAVQCVLSCCSTPADFETFLNKMQGYENVDSFLQFANLTQASLLLGTMLGRHPACAKPFVDNGFDTSLMRKAVKSLSAPDLPLGAMKYTLYSLRFLVRQHVNDFTFAERCLSICSHMASRLGAESAELAADVCSVIQQTTFTASHPNIVAYLLAGCQHWRLTAARKIPIASILARCVVQYPKEQLAQASVRIYKSVSALVCVFTADGTLESVDLIAMLLHCVQCVLRSMPATTAVRYLDFRQLRLLRDFVTDKTPRNAPTFEGVMDRWMSIVMLLWTRAFNLSFSAVMSPLLRLVQGGRLSKALYEKHLGAPYTEQHAAAHDDAVKARLNAALEDGLEVESTETEARRAVDDEERSKRQKVAKRFVEAMEVILSSNTQRYFDAMILPGCKWLEGQLLQARNTSHAVELQGSASPRQDSTQQRHQRLVSSLHKSLVGVPADEQVTTQLTFSLFLNVELSMAKQRDTWATSQRLAISRATEEALLKDKVQTLRHARLMLELEEQSARGFGWHGSLDVSHLPPTGELYPTSIACREQAARAKLHSAFLEHTQADKLTYSAIMGQSVRPNSDHNPFHSGPDTSGENLNASLEQDESLWVPTPATKHRELMRAEPKKRKSLMNEFLISTLLIVCGFDEAEERMLLAGSYAAWVKAATIAATSPGALQLLWTSTELL